MKCGLNVGAIDRVVSLLEGVSLRDVLEVEEVDPQFEAASTVCSTGGQAGAASLFLAALSAFRLRCTGEEYWGRFAKYFAEEGTTADPVEMVARFVLADGCSSLLRDVKVGRIRRFANYSATIGELALNCDFRRLWTLATGVLESEPSSKTIVFAVKMGYYCGRAAGRCTGPLPMDIPIPVDYRVARATLSLGMVSGRSVEEVMGRCRRETIAAWRMVGERTGIPPIHLDALLWALQNPSTFSKAVDRVAPGGAADALRRLREAIAKSGGP